jgi:hypothetical protein
MNWSKCDFVSTMEQGKRAAEQRRNRGLGGGKAAKGWVKAPRPISIEDCTRDPEDMAVLYWRQDVSDAIEDYLRTVYPERYEAWEGV